MKRDVILKGKTVEEKLKSVELILNRISRKLGTKVIGLVPVSPIFFHSHAPAEGGVIARIVFPASGVITKVAFHVDKRGKRPFKIRVDLMNDNLGTEISKTVQVARLTELATLDVKVDAGDRAEITYIPTAEDEVLHDIWMSLLYQVDIKHLNTKTYLLEDLDRLLREDVRSVQDY